MKRSLLLMAALAMPTLAFAAGSPDHAFFRKAAEAGIAEIRAGKLAQAQGTNQAVKDFGSMMVTDHTAAAEKLKILATSEQQSLPKRASLADIAALKTLKLHSGDTFDKDYIKSQLKAHQEAVKLFQDEISSGQDAQAKDFASATLPTLQQHLQKIQQIAATAGVSS